jgi:hypothetical protein
VGGDFMTPTASFFKPELKEYVTTIANNLPVVNL